MVGLPTKRGQTCRDVKYGHIARKTSFIGAFPDELKKGIAPRARELVPSGTAGYCSYVPAECNGFGEGFVLGRVRLGSTVGDLMSWYFYDVSAGVGAGAGADRLDLDIQSVTGALIW
eukprot:scaffold20849_cov55-Attheya_sp.AAC.1